MKRRWLIPGLLFLFPAGAGAQLTGTVVDETGRSIPFATVVSRTNNGFLARQADASGRFAFPGRPHHAGHRVEASMAGFALTSYVMKGEERDITIRLRRDPRPFTGWTIGLPLRATVGILDGDGVPVDAGELRAGVRYRIEVTARGVDECLRPGPSQAIVIEREATVVVGVFVRSGDCGDEGIRIPVELRFGTAGTYRLVVRARYEDIVQSVSVRPS